MIQFYHGVFCGIVRIGGVVLRCEQGKRTHYAHRGCNISDVRYAEISLDGIVYRIQHTSEINVLGSLPIHTPDLVIINMGGLHSRTPHMLEDIFRFPDHIRSKVVWHETVMQHFHTRDGRWGKTAKKVRHEPFCVTRSNATNWKEHNHDDLTLLDLARRYRVPPIPYIAFDAVDANSGHLFPWGSSRDNGTWALDCTHRLYTPLYFDAVFATFTNILCGY
jgi:hypothetical protein